MTEKIQKLKRAAIAYKAAQEWDYCPEPNKAAKVGKFLKAPKEEIVAALTEDQGRRPDEIAGTIIDLIDEL